MNRVRALTCLVAWVALTAGCGAEAERDADRRPGHLDPGSSVMVSPPRSLQQAAQALHAELDAVADITTDELLERHRVEHVPSLSYDPRAAAGLDIIQSSELALSGAELERLGTNGFVISRGRTFPTFAYGYATIYMADLPLYVSADSILDAVHRSYDEILKQIELSALIGELRELVVGMRDRLPSSAPVGLDAQRDADFYLAVALSLLDGSVAAPVAGASAADVQSFVDRAVAADGLESIELFGVIREEDFSQFTPRGHYKGIEELERYFRAMIWLGRVDFRLIETDSDGDQIFRRRQFEGMLALHALMDAASLERHDRIDTVIERFVGESDNMRPEDVPGLLADLGVADAPAAAALPDATIAQAILDGGYGTQRIASYAMINGVGDRTLPLNRSFMLFGQRYVLDSHVFSNVVYDRTPDRMMPDPLDVAYAALGNDQAAQLLEGELRAFEYAPALESMRLLADAHGQEYWSENLYNRWMSSLRALSPGTDTSAPESAGLPEVTGTEPWGRRLLNTQLGSWAQLRHDTILYVKQSYTSGAVCEFPDAYVEPYPEFFSALASFAEQGRSVVELIANGGAAGIAESVGAYFTHLETVMNTLGAMAEQQRAGEPFTAEQMEFINDAVTIEFICGGASVDGWYPRLVWGDSALYDPPIADVHTQPYDGGGIPVGRILHVGTGEARLMVVTADTCIGPRAYAGLSFSYYEAITEDFDRLDDDRWSEQLMSSPPADVEWMEDLIAE